MVGRVSDDDPGLLRYLQEIGLVPGQRIELRHSAPFGGSRRASRSLRITPAATARSA